MLPTHIQIHTRSNNLEVHFDDGTQGTLSAEFLRVHSPSAEVQGHGQPVLQTGKRGVKLTGAEPVGHYAIKLIFNDGHDSGLFRWELLHTFVHTQDTLWASYLATLAEAGARRD